MPIVREDFKVCRFCGRKDFKVEKVIKISIDTPTRLDKSTEIPNSFIYDEKYSYICISCKTELIL